MDKKVIVEYTDRWTAGGIEKYIVNLVTNIQKEEFEFKIVCTQKENDLFDDELLSKKIFVESLMFGVQINPVIRIIRSWKSFFGYMSANKPDIVHLHLCQGVGFVYSFLAKMAGAKCVITHAHSSNCGHEHRLVKILGHKLCKYIFMRNVDIKLACSDVAAKWLYRSTEDARIVNVPIDVDKFIFDEEKRVLLRNKYDIDNELIWLNIGRMGMEKNQLFLVDLFSKLYKKMNAKLFIIGKGELEQEIRDRIENYNIENEVVIINQTNEVSSYMCMADLFVLPSLYEGNPVALVEAQSSGLPCVYSDTITTLAHINKNVMRISLDDDVDIWKKQIEKVLSMKYDRIKCALNVKEKGYSLKQVVEEMEDIYLSCIN